jgi:hypothetical protein
MPLEFHHELLIERPAEAVFHHASHAKSQLQWVGSLVEMRVDSSGPWGPGSTFTQVHEEGGVQQELVGEVLEWAPPRHMLLRLVHSDFHMLSRTDVEDLGPRARLVHSTLLELKSMKLKFAAPMIRGVIENRIREDYDRLKALLES